MTGQSASEKNKYVNLSNAGSIASFCLLIAVIFAVLRFHFYYQILLHVPIFQFIDASELVLITAGYGIKWLIYLGFGYLPVFINSESGFTNFQRAAFNMIIAVLSLFYLWIIFHNDPLLRQSISWPLYFEYWHLIIYGLFVLYLFAFLHPSLKGPVFFQQNKYLLPIILTIYYASFEGLISYQALMISKHNNTVIVKTKNFGIIKTDSIIVDAGRTKNYWFFYDRSKHLTTCIKTDDIETMQFDAHNN